jgi:hypothetical protein
MIYSLASAVFSCKGGKSGHQLLFIFCPYGFFFLQRTIWEKLGGWDGEIDGRLAIMYVDWITEFVATMTVMYGALLFLWVVARAWSMDCFSTFRFESVSLFWGTR